jgi:hypothetical protein
MCRPVIFNRKNSVLQQAPNFTMHRINRLCLTLSLTFMIIGGWIVPSSAPLFAQVDLSQFNVGGDEETDITVTSRFKVDEGARTGKLSVTVELAEGWHIYSVTQGAGGPQKSQIIVEESDKFKLMGEFTPNNDPLVDDPDPVFNVRVEYHDFGVTWTAPIELAEGVRPEELTIKSQLKGQRCIHGRCLQIKENLTAILPRSSRTLNSHRQSGMSCFLVMFRRRQ